MIKTFKGKNTCSEFQWPLPAQPNIRNSNENLDLAIGTYQNLKDYTILLIRD